MKKLLLILSALLMSLSAFAQGESVVRGYVLDPDTGEGEIGAILQFYDSVHDKPVAFTTAAADGAVAALAACDYLDEKRSR